MELNKNYNEDNILAEALIGTIVNYTKDHWSSDWNGDEVGFDDINVVGLYSVLDSSISYYVDTETGYVLDAWTDED